MSPFERAFEIVIGEEGGYVNDPRDPGGETKYGISKRAYPDLDIPGVTLERAHGIYHADYWKRAGCERLPWPLSLYVFDCAVNQGVGVARNLLVLTHDPDEYMERREKRYRATKNFDRFGRGWLNRLANVKVAAENALGNTPA